MLPFIGARSSLFPLLSSWNNFLSQLSKLFLRRGKCFLWLCDQRKGSACEVEHRSHRGHFQPDDSTEDIEPGLSLFPCRPVHYLLVVWFSFSSIASIAGQEKEGRDSLGPIIISCGPKTSLPQVPNEYRLSGGIRELVNGLTVRP